MKGQHSLNSHNKSNIHTVTEIGNYLLERFVGSRSLFKKCLNFFNKYFFRSWSDFFSFSKNDFKVDYKEQKNYLSHQPQDKKKVIQTHKTYHSQKQLKQNIKKLKKEFFKMLTYLLLNKLFFIA